MEASNDESSIANYPKKAPGDKLSSVEQRVLNAIPVHGIALENVSNPLIHSGVLQSNFNHNERKALATLMHMEHVAVIHGYNQDRKTHFYYLVKTPASDVASQQKPLLELKNVKTSADRIAYAEQELAEAKRSGNKKRVEDWEKELKSARMANLKQTQAAHKQVQQSLFNTLSYDDDTPLLRGL